MKNVSLAMSADDSANSTVVTVSVKWKWNLNTDGRGDTHSEVSQCGYTKYKQYWNAVRPIRSLNWN